MYYFCLSIHLMNQRSLIAIESWQESTQSDSIAFQQVNFISTQIRY